MSDPRPLLFVAVVALSAGCSPSQPGRPGGPAGGSGMTDPDSPDAGLPPDAAPDAPAAPAITCPGAGDWCGSDGVQGGDPGTLYHCAAAGQAPSSGEPCAAGCEQMPAGTNDFCATACPSAGDYCGDDKLGGPGGFLFHCAAAGQAPASYTACSGACVTEPQGYDDFCAGACSAQGASALQWEASELAAGNSYSDYCLGFVNQAYQHAGQALGYLQQYDAQHALAAAQATGQFVAWNGTCPCGGILFWSANACNADYGHVVICNGDGTVSTSGWPGYGGSPHADIGWLSTEECGNAPAGYILP